MARFWPQAVLWTTGSICMHPSMPNADAIQATINDLEERGLKPFIEPGNLLTRNLYVDLPLPWTLAPPVADFDDAVFFRKERGPDNSEEFFVGGGLTANLDTVERIIGREIERLLQEAGVEKGKEVVKASLRGVLLIVKKKA